MVVMYDFWKITTVWRHLLELILSCSAFTHLKCTHTHSSKHTHTHTHREHTPGALSISVVLLRVERALDIHSPTPPPPTIHAGLRLELATFEIRVRPSIHPCLKGMLLKMHTFLSVTCQYIVFIYVCILLIWHLQAIVDYKMSHTKLHVSTTFYFLLTLYQLVPNWFYWVCEVQVFQ